MFYLRVYIRLAFFTFFSLLPHQCQAFFPDEQADDNPIIKAYKYSTFVANCGETIQQQFSALNSTSDRLFISFSNGQGANDRIVGLLTGFYAAYLSNRKFQISTTRIHADFSVAFDPSLIDWRVVGDAYETLQTTYEHRINSPEIKVLAHHNGEPLFTTKFGNEEHDIRPDTVPTIMGDTPTIVFQHNRGNVYRLMKESEYKEKFEAAKIRPEYGVYCAFHFLFRPNTEVLQLAEPFSSQLGDPAVLKIGIQIRTGDSALVDGNAHSSLQDTPYYQNSFACAEYLEKLHNPDGSKSVKWYFMSDSLQLRKDVKETYGDKVVTDVGRPPLHSGNANELSDRIEGMKLVMAEVLTFSLCDYFIVSYNSHIAKLGVWISNNRREDNTFVEHRLGKVEPDQEQCRPYRDHDMAIGGPGIRKLDEEIKLR